MARDTPQLREYIGFAWVGDEPGVRLRVYATSLDEAHAMVVERYGEDAAISIWNEEDAARKR